MRSILSIMDMRKDSKSEKFFNLTTWGVKIITVILFVVCLWIHSGAERSKVFLPFIAPVIFLAVFLSYNFLSVHFYKKGFYKSEQAAEFYTKCRERNISLFHEENSEKAKDVYFSVFGTDKYAGEGTLLAHMAEIYDLGREITEKQ